MVKTVYVAPLPSTCFIGTTSSTQNSLAPLTTSILITLTLELETTLGKSIYEITSTTISSSQLTLQHHFPLPKRPEA